MRSLADLLAYCLAGGQKGVVLLGGTDGHPQVAGDADVPDEHIGFQVALPGAVRVGEGAKQDEVRVAGYRREAHAAQLLGDRSRSSIRERTEDKVASACRRASRAAAWVGVDRW